MASNTDNKKQVKEEFHAVKELFDEIRAKHFNDSDCFDTLSAGMSDDYPIAIEEGSTHIRIGSDIFGTPQK